MSLRKSHAIYTYIVLVLPAHYMLPKYLITNRLVFFIYLFFTCINDFRWGLLKYFKRSAHLNLNGLRSSNRWCYEYL